MNNSDGLSFDQLVDWFEGRLSAEDARVVAEGLMADEAAQADVDWLEKFYQSTRSMVSAEPPAAVRKNLERQFAAYVRGRRVANLRPRFVAALRFDSFAGMARGVRTGTSLANQRQFLYGSAKASVVFTLQRRDKNDLIDLLGQVLPESETEVDQTRVLLMQNDEEFDSTITDDLGEFTLMALSPGHYDVVLSNNQFEITIASIDLSI
jgi:hypothetical protein